MALVIGQYDLSTSTMGSVMEILLVPNLADSAGDYPYGGRADQEDRRLERGVIAEIEALIEIGLQTNTRVFMEFDLDITPKWDNQLVTIFYNAARGRIFTHKYTSSINTNTNVKTVGVETLP